MGYVGKLPEKFKAQELRKKGLSYKEIMLQVKVSKDTIGRWCRDIALTEKQKLHLMKNKKLGQKKGSIIAAENRKLERIARAKLFAEKGKADLGKISERDRFIAGIALYLGEGYKTDKTGGFSNANPDVISFMMHWLKEFTKLPMSKFRGAIWLHEGLNETEAKKFWSNLTGIPKNQFHKTYIAKNKIDSNKIRKNIHKNGVFTIRFHSTSAQRQIIGWISALLNDKIEQYFNIPR